MNKLFNVVILTIVLSSCTHIFTSKKLEMSSAAIGCKKENIKIEDEGGTSWTAICKGKKYYCTATVGQYGGGSSGCTEAKD